MPIRKKFLSALSKIRKSLCHVLPSYKKQQSAIQTLEERMTRLERANLIILKRLLQLGEISDKTLQASTTPLTSSSLDINVDDTAKKPTYH